MRASKPARLLLRRSSDSVETVGRVLLVEDRAHTKHGHAPVMFAELAAALRDVGCHVTVLTAEGWALEDANHEFEVWQLGRPGITARRWGTRLAGVWPRRYTRRVGAVVRDLSMIAAVRAARRRLGGADVIITSHRFDPYVAACAAGPGRWLMYQFRRPGDVQPYSRGFLHDWPSHHAVPSSALAALAHRAERRRNRRDGFARVVVNNESHLSAWTDAAPWLRPVQLPYTACREHKPIADSRQRLDLDPDRRVALLFGSPHGLKDPHVAYEVFDKLPEWQLVIAGAGAAESFHSWSRGVVSDRTAPVVVDGFASEETRQDLHAAADLVVLSFKPDSPSDSGTLVDAISWGLPVVCSDRSYAAEVVKRFGLGPIFESGNPKSLAEALRSAPRSLSAEAVARAREATSPRRMALQHLAALERQIPAGGIGL